MREKVCVRESLREGKKGYTVYCVAFQIYTVCKYTQSVYICKPNPTTAEESSLKTACLIWGLILPSWKQIGPES